MPPRSRFRLLTAGLLLTATVLAGLLLWRAAEPRGPVPLIGIIHPTAVDSETAAGFKAGLERLGLREPRGVRYLYHGPAGERLADAAAELVERKVDLIFVSSTPATLAVRRALAGHDIPVVFGPVNDPVGAGIVPSLKSPAGPTGIRLSEGDSLRLQWLTRVAPGVRRVWFPYSPGDPSAVESLRRIAELAPALGVELLADPLPGPAAIERRLRRPPRGIDAIMLPRDSRIESYVDRFVPLARRERLPLSVPGVDQVRDGALLSYGFVHREIGEQAARLAYQILSGVAPADLPVERAENFLAINLETADAIGLALPDTLLRQAHILIRGGRDER